MQKRGFVYSFIVFIIKAYIPHLQLCRQHFFEKYQYNNIKTSPFMECHLSSYGNQECLSKSKNKSTFAFFFPGLLKAWSFNINLYLCKTYQNSNKPQDFLDCPVKTHHLPKCDHFTNTWEKPTYMKVLSRVIKPSGPFRMSIPETN